MYRKAKRNINSPRLKKAQIWRPAAEKAPARLHGEQRCSCAWTKAEGGELARGGDGDGVCVGLKAVLE